MPRIADDQADRAVGQQLGRDARPDHLDAAIVDLVAERRRDLRHRRLLRGLAARLLRHADQHVGRRAELLQLHLAEAEAAERRAHLGEIGGAALRLHLHQRAAVEVDAEVQPVEEVEKDRQDRQQRRHRKADAPEAHEIEFGVVRYDAKKAHEGDRFRRSMVQIGTVLGRHQRTHVATISRVSVKAVNTVVMMPMPSVTAKPRTGPVPM